MGQIAVEMSSKLIDGYMKLLLAVNNFVHAIVFIFKIKIVNVRVVPGSPICLGVGPWARKI